jgi:hypothetical protein
MHPDTATRRLTKRAADFYGMTFEHYIVSFTYIAHLNDKSWLALNDNGSMQQAFAVWVSVGDRRQKLTDFHNRRAQG